MPYRELLRTTFEKCGIKRVAIVDDAFDEPDFEQLAQDGFTALRTRLDDLVDEPEEHPDAGEVIAAIESAVGQPVGEMAKRLREPAVVQPLWELFAAADPAGAVYATLSPLFGVLGAERRDKLHPLLILRKLIQESSDATVETFDSSTNADQVVGVDMVLLDFFLAPDVPLKPGTTLSPAKKKAARARSIRFLADLVEQAQDATPLVMLISSMASAEDMPDFRAESLMLASKMSFMNKDFATSDIARVQHTILTLAKHKPHADALVTLIKMWSEAVDAASKQLMVSVRELDLTDYSYLQHYRLATEKTPLAQYLTWLFSGQLTDAIERELEDRDVEALVKGIELPAPVPGLVPPTPGIARIYSALTTSRIPVANDRFKPVAWAGDIYLATERYNDIFGKALRTTRRQKALPEIMAVVTPACDLVPGRSREAGLRTVTMIGGRLVPLGETVHPNVHLVLLNDKPFTIMWDPKWPVTMSVDAMGPGSTMAGRYQWVGRLRDLYHAELQHKLTSDLGRVGLPVAPTMPESVPVRILARTGAAAAPYETVFQEDAARGAAWTFAGKEGKRSFCLRADVAWDVRRWILDQPAASRPVQNLRSYAEADAFLLDLQSPVHFGGTSDTAQGSASNKVRYKRVEDPAAETGATEQVGLLVAVGRG